MKIKLYPNESKNRQTTDLLIVICWICLNNLTTFLHSNCVDYRQITKVNVSLLIIHTKRMFASRKEGWAGETKKRHRKCSFCQSWFVGFCCLGLIFMAQHLMKYLLFGHPCFATFNKVYYS